MRVIATCAAAVLVAGSALAAELTLKAEMKQVVDPATNTVFAVGGEVDPANGPDAAKVPAARWAEAQAAAAKLKAPAARLTSAAYKAKGTVWTSSAADFARLAAAAEAAAKNKDGAALSKAANDLGDTCTACHTKFKPQTG
jgi:cytochrome c556